MSFEIVYTSVRRGLRTGSKGFCTVAATEGIPRALHEKLESLSGYNHHEAAAGAVNHSHLIVRIQRKVFHVLSRIADAGKDYSGRTNKIAHHLALTTAETEQFSDGPAALFEDSDFWYSHWEGGPEEFAPHRLPETCPDTDGDFDTWESVFGDAGWAGLLGESCSGAPQQVSVIVPNGNHTMALLTEAMQLVPPEKRWKLCFSTYFFRQPPGTQCHWRFVMDGTQEARRLRARTSLSVVDYATTARQKLQDSPYVQAARSGTPQLVHQSKPARKKRSRAEPVSSSGRRSQPSDRRRRSREEVRRPPRPAQTNPFDIDESELNTAPETVAPRRRPVARKAGVWLVLLLLIAIVTIIAIFAYQQVS